MNDYQVGITLMFILFIFALVAISVLLVLLQRLRARLKQLTRLPNQEIDAQGQDVH